MKQRNSSGRFHKDLGTNLCSRGKYKAAIDAFNTALATNPKDHYCLRKAAECYAKLGDNASAVRCWEMLGERLARIGEHRKAIAAYRMVQRLDPQDLTTQGVIEFIQVDLAVKTYEQNGLLNSDIFKKPTLS